MSQMPTNPYPYDLYGNGPPRRRGPLIVVLCVVATLIVGIGVVVGVLAANGSDDTESNARALGTDDPTPPALPEPDPTPVTPDTPATPEPTAPSPPSGPLNGVDPCSLLSDSDQSRMPLADEEYIEIGGTPVCRLRYEGRTIRISYTVQVELWGYGIDQVVGTEVDSIPDVGSHRAIIFGPPAGGCGISLEVAPKARVDVTAVGGDLLRACDIVHALAGWVEPNLPSA